MQNQNAVWNITEKWKEINGKNTPTSGRMPSVVLESGLVRDGGR